MRLKIWSNNFLLTGNSFVSKNDVYVPESIRHDKRLNNIQDLLPFISQIEYYKYT